MEVYFDNAATTPLDEEVLAAMLPYFTTHFGNPSSIHKHGRVTRAAIEKARKKIADLLNASPAEIFFTSGGTEADNMALRSAVETLKITNVVTSKIEHHAILHTLENLEKENKIKLNFVPLNEKGHLDYEWLEKHLAENRKSLVCLMHGNNEIGNLNDIDIIGKICKETDSIFHCDTVQTAGHYKHNLQELHVHTIAGAAHKFHGPKGVGFLFIRNAHKINPLIYGGAQERNMRGGTENVYGIIGLAKALEVAYQDMEDHKTKIIAIKTQMIDKLKTTLPEISYNGDCANLEKSLYTVLSLSLPPSEMTEMLLFNLDIHNVSASGGSACSSGSNLGSHVLSALNSRSDRASVRFSFSKYNLPEEVDYVVDVLTQLYKVPASSR